MAAQINPTIGDLEKNTEMVLKALGRARKKQADAVLFPELALTGYFPDDLLLDPLFIDDVERQLHTIAPATQGLFVAIGLPRWNPRRKEKPLLNSAAIFFDGRLVGFQDKTLLPTYDVFDERRFFEPGSKGQIWECLGHRIAITICEDLWQHSGLAGYTNYSDDPVLYWKRQQPDLVFNLSASPYSFERRDVRLFVFRTVAKTLGCPLVMCNQVGANDQLIFDGYSFYLDEKGELVQIAKGFAEDDLLIELHAQARPCCLPEDGVKDLYAALVLGVRDYMHKQGFKKALLGLSGGIDSAVAACIAREALGAENVLAFGLPSRFSSPDSIPDAERLARNLNLSWNIISIDSLFQNFLDLLEPMFQNLPFDAAEENIQSRIRGMILMAFSNKFGALLLNAGNKSEMAMGYMTLYGDMAGALGVLHDVTKLHVYQLAAYVNRTGEIIPQSIIDKAPSAELKENQRDLDALPRYEILDPVIEDYIERRLSPSQIAVKHNLPLRFVLELIRKIHSAEYKRRQAPIGLRVTQKAFGKGRYVPIVQKRFPRES